MEGKPSRGRGGSWRRGGGGGGGNEAGSSGEHRGRGRGGYRGRGKRGHYRGRGGPLAASATHRDLEQHDDSKNLEEEEIEVFSRRKLESNWDRYEESEKEALNEDDTPTQRGTDFHILLESAGDSYSQFRFTEEKEWEIDALAVNQIASMFLDLPALVQSLQELPLHQRLNLDADLVQISTPVELPNMRMEPRQVKPQTPAPKGLGTSLGLSSAISPASGNVPQGLSNTVKPQAEDIDEELDRLLSLQTPVSVPSEALPEEETNTIQDQPILEKEEEPIVEEASASSKPEPVKQEVTEEDLEDWLDSMIS
ncbi:cell death regulator Aven [Osmerus mordax]|uniref:cell death regulator Aven n=1 Tax=Osmerus mordax TaxID=8014 RepID=UPI0035104E93